MTEKASPMTNRNELSYDFWLQSSLDITQNVPLAFHQV